MTTFSQWRPLLPSEIESVPAGPAVYELATLVRTIIYIGTATDLGEALTRHLARAGTLSAPGRRYFRYVATEHPEQMQRQLLADYQRTHQGTSPVAQATPPMAADTRRHLQAV
jgi:hypothetical protein